MAAMTIMIIAAIIIMVLRRRWLFFVSTAGRVSSLPSSEVLDAESVTVLTVESLVESESVLLVISATGVLSLVSGFWVIYASVPFGVFSDSLSFATVSLFASSV